MVYSDTSPPGSSSKRSSPGAQRKVRLGIIGVPSALGGPPRGAEYGPAEIRRLDLAGRLSAGGHDVVDYGDVAIPARPSMHATPPSILEPLLRRIAGQCECVFADRRLPLVVGGDHSIAIGSIAAASLAVPSLGVLWLDAHPDFNTLETSPSGNLHGMVLAIATGSGPVQLTSLLGARPMVDPSRVAVIGVRSVDEGEVRNLRRSGIHIIPCAEALRLGPRAAVRQALAHLATNGARAIHVSVDLDVLDPSYWPGVSTPEAGGLSAHELCLAVNEAASLGPVVAVDIVELTPRPDRMGSTAAAAVNVVEQLAAGLSRSSRARRSFDLAGFPLPPAA